MVKRDDAANGETQSLGGAEPKVVIKRTSHGWRPLGASFGDEKLEQVKNRLQAKARKMSMRLETDDTDPVSGAEKHNQIQEVESPQIGRNEEADNPNEE